MKVSWIIRRLLESRMEILVARKATLCLSSLSYKIVDLLVDFTQSQATKSYGFTHCIGYFLIFAFNCLKLPPPTAALTCPVRLPLRLAVVPSFISLL